MKKSLLVLSALALAAPLRASLKYPAEIGPQIGYLWIEGDTDIKNTPLVGARFGTYLDYNTSAELSVLSGKSDIRSSDKNADILLPTLEFQHYFTEATELVRPYISAGIGYLQINRDRAIRRNDIDFAVLYGLGVKWQFAKSFLARVDGRHLMDTASGRGTHSGLFTVGVSWIYGNEDVAPKPAPAPVVTDSDNDGVPDDRDRCPDTPAGTRVNNAGCPLDSDGDGVTDGNDKCPDTPAGMQVDENGCPLPAKTEAPAPAPVESVETAVPEKEWVLSGVNFETSSDKLTSASIKGLEEAVTILNAHPNVCVEIQGNTDRTGDPARNMVLSKARAEAVKNYLVGRGVSAERLETRGLGVTNPIASNKTIEGRAKNRRIEFKVLSR